MPQKTRQPLPTVKQAKIGMRLAASNAWTHILCAQTLQDEQHLGPATAHLIYAVEEAVKARVLHRWPVLVEQMSAAALRDLLYVHQVC